MIPILYSRGETDFTHNGLGFLTDIASASVTEERNGVYELSFQYPISGQGYELISNGCIVKAKANETSELQLFKIYKSSKPIRGIVTFSAEHISYALNGLPLAGFSIASATPQMAMRRALQNTPLTHNFTAESDIASLNSTTIKTPCSVRGLLGGQEGSILDVWGGEYEFDNFTVILHASRGENNGVTIEYGKNLTDIKQEENISECYTHLMPYAVYNQDDGNGNSREVYVYLPEEVLPLPTAANLGHEKALIYDFSDTFGDNEVPTAAKLRTRANSFIAHSDLTTPKVNITVSFIQLWQTEEYKNVAPLERVRLCDIVGVRFSKLGVQASAKVIKTVYDVVAERYQSVTLGDAKSNFADTVNKQTSEITRATALVKSGISQATAELNNAIRSATDAITGQSGGYVVLNPAHNPQEILIMDEPDIEDATNVWRWNSAGLGYSSTGYNGTYSTAITYDGKIVADFIAAGTLNGALLRAGSVEANALSVAYKQSVQSDIDSSANTVRQEFAVADQQVISSINTTLQSYSTTQQMNSAITQSAQSISSQVSQTLTSYSTTQQMNDAIDGSINTALADYSTTTEMSSAITQTASSITAEVRQKVGYSELGAKIELNYDSVRVAWNQCSSYIAFKYGDIIIYDGANTNRKKVLFDYKGMSFYHKDILTGKIGTNYWTHFVVLNSRPSDWTTNWKNYYYKSGNNYIKLSGNTAPAFATGTYYKLDDSHKGLVFDLEANSSYMCWAVKNNSSGYYETRLAYFNDTVSGNSVGLHFQCKTFSDGNLYLDNTYNIAKLRKGGVAYSGGFYFGTRTSNGNGGFNYTLYCGFSGKHFTIYNNANVNFYSNINMHNYNIIGQSDIRVKKNVAPTQINGLSVLNALDLKEFTWCKINEFVPIGIIAQQLNEVAPELIETSETGLMSIKTNNLIYYAIKAIQELSGQVEGLVTGTYTGTTYTKAPLDLTKAGIWEDKDDEPIGAPDNLDDEIISEPMVIPLEDENEPEEE